MKVTQDTHGFHRDEKGRFLSKKQLQEYKREARKAGQQAAMEFAKGISKKTGKVVNVALNVSLIAPLIKKVAKLSRFLGNSLAKNIRKSFRAWKKDPFKEAFNSVKGIFKFLGKIASMSFNSLIKLFGLLWVWSKLGSLGGLNELSQAGHGGGGTGGGSQAAQRADTTFGTNHYKTLYDNIQNMANNPALWGNFVKLGFTNEDIKRFGSQDPSQSIREFLQGVEKRKDDLGGWQSYQAQTIMSGALSGLGLDFANMRGVSERGISGEQEKYFKQQQRNNAGLEKMEREYIKLQFEFTDLWRHFAVSLGPTMMKISRIFIKFGHRLAKFLGTNDNMEKALEGLYNVTVRVFEWLGTKGFDYVDKFFTWFDETGLPLLKKGWEWIKDLGQKAYKVWNSLNFDNIQKGWREFVDEMQPVIDLLKMFGAVIKSIVVTISTIILKIIDIPIIKDALGLVGDMYMAGFNNIMGLLTGDKKYYEKADDIYNRRGSIIGKMSNEELAERAKKIGFAGEYLQRQKGVLDTYNALPKTKEDLLKEARSAKVMQQSLSLSGDATLTINIEDGRGTKTISVQEMLNSFTMNNNQAGRGN